MSKTSREKKDKGGDNMALAGAMKKLQEKIS